MTEIAISYDDSNMDLLKLASPQPKEGEEKGEADFYNLISFIEDLYSSEEIEIDYEIKLQSQSTESQEDTSLLSTLEDSDTLNDKNAYMVEVDSQISSDIGYLEAPNEKILNVLKKELNPDDLQLYSQPQINNDVDEQQAQSLIQDISYTPGQAKVAANIKPSVQTNLIQQIKEPETGQIQAQQNIQIETSMGQETIVEGKDQILKDIFNIKENTKKDFDLSDHSPKNMMDSWTSPNEKPLQVNTPAQQSLPQKTFQTHEVMQQVATQVKQAVDGGKDKITVHLNPPSLGKIEVELRFSAEGHVWASLTMDKSDTFDMLNRNPVQLKEILSESGFDSSTSDFTFNLKDEDSSPSQNTNKTTTHQFIEEEQSIDTILYKANSDTDKSKEVDIHA